MDSFRTGRLNVVRLVMGRTFLAGLLAVLALCLPASAGGPIETNIFAVQGVDVDVTSTDASAAKNQALMDVQVKAFQQLVERLGSPELRQEVEAKFKPEDIAPYLRSLSIEEETSAPGRYIGRFTVRFLPDKMQKFFKDYGIRLPSRQADPILVLPVYRGADANKLWEDNPWRKQNGELQTCRALLCGERRGARSCGHGHSQVCSMRSMQAPDNLLCSQRVAMLVLSRLLFSNKAKDE